MLRSLATALALLFIAGCGSVSYKAPVRDAKDTRTPPPVVKPLPPARPGHYRVQAGDTLYKIAFENGLDYQGLASWNDLADPNLIRIGEELRLTAPVEAVRTAPLPATPTFTHRPTEPGKPDATPVAPTAPVTGEDADAAPGSWVWPAKGEVITRFNSGSGSKGIDVANRRGTPILATAPGRVVYAGSGLRGYGKLSIIKHSKTLLSAYGHQDEIYVKEGQLVSQSQAIGRMGDTDADRVKLHFEIREFGKPVDPINYLPNIGGDKWGVE